MAAQRADEWADSPDLSAGDKDLTLSFQRGDKGAYDIIYLRHVTRVENLCERMLRHPQDAQDAVQETFLRVYKALPKFNGRYQLGPWITRIATNVCLDKIRSRSRSPRDGGDVELLEDVSNPSREDDPEQLLMRKAEVGRMVGILETLTPMQRAIIVLRDFEGLAYSDIAIALGITECRVRVLMHRARKAFKRSWSSAGASIALWPRLLQRLRRIKAPVSERITHAASSLGSPGHAGAPIAEAGWSCNAMLQQCGGFLVERIGTAVTTAAVAIAVAGGSHISSTGALPEAAPAGRSEASVTKLVEVPVDPNSRMSAQDDGLVADDLSEDVQAPGELETPVETIATDIAPVSDPGATTDGGTVTDGGSPTDPATPSDPGDPGAVSTDPVLTVPDPGGATEPTSGGIEPATSEPPECSDQQTTEPDASEPIGDALDADAALPGTDEVAETTQDATETGVCSP